MCRSSSTKPESVAWQDMTIILPTAGMTIPAGIVKDHSCESKIEVKEIEEGAGSVNTSLTYPTMMIVPPLHAGDPSSTRMPVRHAQESRQTMDRALRESCRIMRQGGRAERTKVFDACRLRKATHKDDIQVAHFYGSTD